MAVRPAINQKTLLREMKEETGVDVKPLKFVETWNYVIKSCKCNDVSNVLKSTIVLNGLASIGSQFLG